MPQQKTPEQLYRETLKPFQLGLILLVADLILLLIMRVMWIGGVLLAMPFFVILFIFTILFLISLTNALKNIPFVSDIGKKKKLKIILAIDLILVFFLVFYIISTLYIFAVSGV